MALVHMPMIGRIVCCAAACALLASGPDRRAGAGDDWPDIQVPAERLVGSLSCASASCHGSSQPRPEMTSGQGQEYLHWFGGTQATLDGRPHYDPRARLVKHDGDPHALAAQRLVQPRFQEVLRRASRLPGGEIDPAVSARCANCHDPLGLAGGSARNLFVGRGIGCESCHGGARDWLSAHYQRGTTRSQLEELGMIDTHDVLSRARVCAACHVGSAENDVNHDLLAAGHPPLRFEMASYQALITRKHWNDAPRRIAEPDYEVQLWAAGRIASADAALALLENRAKNAAVATDETRTSAEGDQGVWPEFAEYNCFACHQSLRPSASGRPTGALAWQTWNVSLVPLGKPAAENMDRLRHAMERTFLANPREIADLATQTRSALRDQSHSISIPIVLNLLAEARDPLSWDSTCQKLAAILAMERAIGHDDVRQHAQRVGESLRFAGPEVQWPPVLQDPRSLSRMDAELNALRSLLLMEEQAR